MKKILHYLFFPYHNNNHRAKILHHKSIFVVVGVLIIQGLLFSQIKVSYPPVLGASVSMSSQDLLNYTNQKRSEQGLQPLHLDSQLTQAAQAKAAYMFVHNFWAHNAPDGTTPWDFIKNVHYAYIYAGENLA